MEPWLSMKIKSTSITVKLQLACDHSNHLYGPALVHDFTAVTHSVKLVILREKCALQ